MRLMAEAISDSSTAEKMERAVSAGQAKLLQPKPSGPLWNETSGFFTAHSETTTQVFTDSLYGEMLSHHMFNGTVMVDKGVLLRHLAYEWQENQDKYGMRVLSSPIQ